MSPKYHPEIAGLGIEYCWGKSKLCFRREVNDCKSANLYRNVLMATGDTRFRLHGKPGGPWRDAPLPVARIRRFARRTRDLLLLLNMFTSPDEGTKVVEEWRAGNPPEVKDVNGTEISLAHLGEPENVQDMLMKLYNLNKTHCCAMDIFPAFCDHG